ncbi:hypothetical protein EII14_08725 [Alloprevotella sp. OH1205_COT-284]|uniref:hypothetical protein n=1 Tax=Alloprevotella sp. OH1205_COT-284 TaxID=2491043 RepID=UPI000F5FEB25|nr:hypothetical protein [Alloprevotella sp. OH1205_COT-284]RRD75199.1 hypothetical protein EII14_08725 [Alloprevotella sp. OH1205_COT-284]
MDKKEFKKEKAYVKPTIEVVRVDIEGQMLAGSPAVQPGGGSISVEPPKEDEDEEISGAKKFNMWSEWED